jgi:hypothetical protein
MIGGRVHPLMVPWHSSALLHYDLFGPIAASAGTLEKAALTALDRTFVVSLIVVPAWFPNN